MPTIVHFEIPADDVERSRKFYSDLFGWKIEKFPGQTGGSEDMEYWLITTTDDKGNKALGVEKTRSTTANYQSYRRQISRRIFDQSSAIRW